MPALPSEVKKKHCVWHKEYIGTCKLCQSENKEEKKAPVKSNALEETSKHRYFISNYFIEKVFDNVMTDIKISRLKLEEQMELLTEKVESLSNIR